MILDRLWVRLYMLARRATVDAPLELSPRLPYPSANIIYHRTEDTCD